MLQRDATNWVRFRHRAQTGFGVLTQSDIAVHDGEMFGASKPSGRMLALGDVELLAPSEPSKIIALWNNFHALAAKLQPAGAARAAVSPEGHLQRHGAGRGGRAPRLL